MSYYLQLDIALSIGFLTLKIKFQLYDHLILVLRKLMDMRNAAETLLDCRRIQSPMQGKIHTWGAQKGRK